MGMDSFGVNEELRTEFVRALLELRNLQVHHYGGKKHIVGKGINSNAAECVYELNMPAFELLKQLQLREKKEETGSALLSEMQDYLRVSKAAISQMLGNLENRKLVTRETDPENRRAIIVKLTKEGHEMIEHVEQVFGEHINMIIDRFGEKDTKEIIRLIYKFSAIARDTNNETDLSFIPR
jgi:DNA-binding MarR family transcriptional regulator